jgi:hypothetical protein
MSNKVQTSYSPNPVRYPAQSIIILLGLSRSHVYVLPCDREHNVFFLRTVFLWAFFQSFFHGMLCISRDIFLTISSSTRWLREPNFDQTHSARGWHFLLIKAQQKHTNDVSIFIWSFQCTKYTWLKNYSDTLQIISKTTKCYIQRPENDAVTILQTRYSSTLYDSMNIKWTGNGENVNQDIITE